MATWSMGEAQARFIQLFDAAASDGPQFVVDHNGERIVVIAESAWTKLQSALPSFTQLVLDSGVKEEDLPKRLPARSLSRR
ncbi:type II toxin-antitoxin system Phd/YefM family antitoxin [Corticibacterium sp. UT-5YL-CI-8]|nr:type II toxin-antitoxin system Phd/YefM family antitoxin [Tianweitania sp. UT-5YL-CI-8]